MSCFRVSPNARAVFLIAPLGISGLATWVFIMDLKCDQGRFRANRTSNPRL
jgi:hypothetical protein